MRPCLSRWHQVTVTGEHISQLWLGCMQVNIGMFAPSTGKIDDRWQQFMQFQIKRARQYFGQAEAGVDFLDKNARWPVW